VAPLRGAIAETTHALMLGAMRAAEDLAAGLDAMADDPATAMAASRRQGLDGALEAIERHGLAAQADAERLVQGFGGEALTIPVLG